jgi:hypothetical protein
MPQDPLVGVGTVSNHVDVGEAFKGVAIPCLDSLKPSLLDQEAKVSMVETYKGTNAREVEAPRVKNGVGCLGSHGHGLGHPIQVVDGDVLPGIIGSIDALVRERLDVDMAGT